MSAHAPLPGYHDVRGEDRSALLSQVLAQRERVRERLQGVRRVVAVASGKGGVGKSTVAAALALGAAMRGARVGVLDADLKGPTMATLLGAAGPVAVDARGARPALGREGVRVMSMELLLAHGRPLAWRAGAPEAFVWRGALEAGTLRELLGDTDWGALDLLVVDLPPDGDRVEDLAGLDPALEGVVIVTIPSDESLHAVERGVRRARDLGVRVLGIVENMSGYRCGACGAIEPLFHGHAADTLAATFDAPVLARVPFTAARRDAGDDPLAPIAAGLGEVTSLVLSLPARDGGGAA